MKDKNLTEAELKYKRLFALSDQLDENIKKLKSAGMMKKTVAAELVLEDIQRLFIIQNVIIHTLSCNLENINRNVDILRERLGL